MSTRHADGTLEEGRRVLAVEARAVQALVERLDHHFSKAVELLMGCKGKVVVSGMGKSGQVGQKIAATLASTGTPSFFLHPAEGIHGDLGMVAKHDVMLAISNSGEVQEVLQLLPFVKRINIPLVALTGRVNSTLAKNSDVTLDVSVSEEACPLGLTPTASTTAALAMGDALAIALLQRRGFKQEDYAQFHPGGTLGRRLLVKVRDLMHTGSDMPRVRPNTPGSEAMLEMTGKRLGMTTVLDEAGKLVGVVTDGDLRRFLQGGGDFTTATAAELANPVHKRVGEENQNRTPKTVGPDELATAALALMERHTITALVVIDRHQRAMGVVHLHDILKNGIV
ncbi:D-arabinose 5-phosphate isomerase [Nitrospira sp. KM1]|uniref:KpsF/GutQ family sugar-phosphate isomerase n=1 Tax=Nitrospira sp. KM1 TaxID=1936990 RepID=UPI0013A735C8|nr:KpsF/GutQ family sugar-phosphate isomerase [Nitrospira sp. KM1]BCA54045.1 D-arabinose 5-phosphate isomerase [Nitrospira sp. KM1]